MRALSWLFQRTLNSVPFGITVLAAIALYIAIGSGCVSLREHLEMDELLFFNWWPFKILIALLVANLTVVTVSRIPLTPPRYGVWTIHMGIILLVMSLSAYYTLKTEGMVPLVKGRTSDYYYDRWERALFVRTQFSTGAGITLPGLPRFHEYDEPYGNASVLDHSQFRNLKPTVRVMDPQTGRSQVTDLGASIGLPNPVTLDVLGYYPCGIAERYHVDPTSRLVGLRVRVGEADDTKPLDPNSPTGWLVGGVPMDSILPLGTAVLEHRNLPTKDDVALATNAAKRLHKLTIRVGGHAEEHFVEPGDSIPIAGTPYAVTVEGFTPQFELSDGSGRADMLTVHVHRDGAAPQSTTRPTTQPAPNDFRRTILSGTNLQTDFDLQAAGAGPFGKRIRDHLLDEGIQLAYTFSDPTTLLPTMDSVTVKYLLFTSDDSKGITLLRVSSRDASVVIPNEDGHVNLRVTAPAPMLGVGDETELVRLNLERMDHLAVSSAIRAIPPEKRGRDTMREGEGQMVRVRVKSGDWSHDYAVPFSQFAADNTWSGAPIIKIPGSTGDFQLCLGNRRIAMPLSVRLDAFEPIPYAGGETNRAGVMRDFHSTITLTDRETGDSHTEQTSLNNPAFFEIPSAFPLLPGQSWLLSQASWNPQDHDQTTLQIGNRPGVSMMIGACCMIFSGLLYAFYAKPLIIRRMKADALRRATERKRPTIPEAEVVGEPAGGGMAPLSARDGPAELPS